MENIALQQIFNKNSIDMWTRLIHFLKTKNIIHATVLLTIMALLASYLSSSNQCSIYNCIIINVLFIAVFFIHALVLIPLLIKKLAIKKYIIITLCAYFLLGISVILFTQIESWLYHNSINFKFLFNFEEAYFAIILNYILSLIYSILILGNDYKIKFAEKILTPRNIQRKGIFIIHSIFLAISVGFLISSILNIQSIGGKYIWASVYISILWVITSYLFSLILIPNLFYKKPFSKHLIITLTVILFFGLLESWFLALGSSAITYHADGSPSIPTDFLSIKWYIGSLRHSIPIVLISFFYSMIIHMIKSNSNYFSKIIGKREAELSLLKSQVNPHFLFNSLNILYATALEEGSRKTAEITSKLANLVRYMMEDINLEFIPLEKEVKYIQDYLNIQLSRCSVQQDVEIVIKNIENKQISPGLLITFIENAFKHGINPSKKSYLIVKIGGDNHTIDFECKNSISKNNKLDSENGLGIGIENVKQRLALIYPKKYIFKTEEKDEFFTVKLSISTN